MNEPSMEELEAARNAVLDEIRPHLESFIYERADEKMTAPIRNTCTQVIAAAQQRGRLIYPWGTPYIEVSIPFDNPTAIVLCVSWRWNR